MDPHQRIAPNKRKGRAERLATKIKLTTETGEKFQA